MIVPDRKEVIADSPFTSCIWELYRSLAWSGFIIAEE